jgi:chromosome segregation ATPase
LNLKEQIAKTEEKQHQEYETLSTAHHDVSQQYEELQAVLQTFVTANESFNTEHEKLLTMLKKENENSTQLKEELELALANYSNTHLRAQSLEDELQKTSQKVASLQEELGLQHANLASKQNELDSEIVAHTLAKTESETTIAELRNSVENYQGNLHQKELDIGALTERHNEEKKRLHELNVAIQLAAAADINSDNRISQLQSLLEEKETITASLEHQLNERNAKIQLQNSETVQSYDTIAFLNQTIENYENELNQKETEIAALQAQTGDREHALATIEQLNHSINHYQNELTLREREVAAITAQHEFEKSQQQELNTSLENASLSKQYGDEEIVALRTQLEHSATAASSLEKLIHTQGSELNEVMQQYKQLSEALENEKLHSSGLHQALNNSLLEVENEQQKSVALHQLLQTNSATLTFLQERMAEKEKELELRSGIVALTTHEAELRVSQQQEQISHLMYEIQNEKQKTEQIIASNIEVREKAESLAQSTEQLLHKVNIHRKQIALLESDLYAKEASRDSLREEVVKLTAAFEEEKQNANQSMASTSEQEKVNTLKEELQQNIKELTHLFKVVSDKEEEIIALRNTTMAQKQIINKLNKEIAENRSFEKGEKDNF